ncbi:hypothetical protein GQ457_08G003740 [Hibiscus cannabinus]
MKPNSSSHRVSINAIKPWIIPGRLPHTAHRTPNHAVAFKPRTERHLPDPVISFDPFLGFQIRQFIPYAAARRVAEPVQRHPRGFHVAVAELQVLLQLVQHGLARCVHAEVFERELVVRDIWLGGWREGGFGFVVVAGAAAGEEMAAD